MSAESRSPVDLKLTVFNSGWVSTHHKVALTGGPGGEIDMPALFAMIEHPEQGVMLYDTGYNTNFYEATQKLPYRIMRLLTPARIQPEDNADAQLEAAGVSPDQMKTIILGHGHVDHVPGVYAFREAKLVVDRREWEFMQRPALKIFTHGYIKSLYQDLENPLECIDFESQGKPLGPFGQAVDLLGDGSMILTLLPGHTAGQMGLLLSLADGRRFFLIGDAAWLCENYLEMRPPARVARLIVDDNDNFMRTLQWIHDFHLEFPDVIIVPAHCPTTWKKLQGMGVAG